MAAEAKPTCQYGAKCFRTNAAHRTQFSHPPSTASIDKPDSSPKKKNVVLNGKQVMFVGLFPDSSREKIVATAKSHGCVIASTLGIEVDLVIAADGAGTKVQEAQDLGVEVMSQNDWEALLAQAKPVQVKTPVKKAGAHAMSDGEDSQPTEPLPFQNFEEVDDKMDVSSTAVKRSADDDDGGASPSKKAQLEIDTTTPRATTPGPYSPHASSHSPTPDRSLSPSPSPSPVPSPAPSPGGSRSPSPTGSRSPSPSPAGRTSRSPSPSPGGKRRQKCHYWDKCYRKDLNHLAGYLHPGDQPDPESESDDDDDTGDGANTRAAKRAKIKPKHEITDGQEVEVLGGGGSFRLKRTGDAYFCTCYEWKNQSIPSSKRTCKHLKDHLGEKFEKARVGEKAMKEKKTSSLFPYQRVQRHKQVSVLLAHKWTEKVNPTGWWMSEKLDGVRAYWDGTTFFSRLGNEFIAPKWFIANMPSDMAIDGELFGGRGKFQSTVKIVKNHGCDDWKKIKYCVFDSPSIKEPFEKRIASVKDHFEKHKCQYVEVLEQYKCKGAAHLQEELKRIIGLGGEGVMVREPKSKYVGGRSHSLLKLKMFHDAEAVVINYEPGKGSNTGAVGALRCRMECGIEFSVGSGLTNAERRKPPKKGSIITYRFQEYTNSGKPRFPTYVGIRIDADGPKDCILPDKPDDDD